MADGELAGYVLFSAGGVIEHLVHPLDERTGLHHGILPMIHAISADLLTPQQARTHLAVIGEHLLGPDGARLFDRRPTAADRWRSSSARRRPRSSVARSA